MFKKLLSPNELKMSVYDYVFNQFCKEKPIPILPLNDVNDNQLDVFRRLQFNIHGYRFYSFFDLFHTFKKGCSLTRLMEERYKENKKGIPFIRARDIINNKIIYDEVFHIDNPESFLISKKDSILLCTLGASCLNKIAYVDQDVAFVNTFISFSSPFILNKYAYYFCQSVYFKEQCKPYLRGMIKGLNNKDLKKMIMAVPDVKTQAKIIEKLDLISPLLYKYEILYKKVKENHQNRIINLKDDIFNYLFASSFNIPFKTSHYPLKEILEVRNIGKSISLKEKMDNNIMKDDTIPYLKASDIALSGTINYHSGIYLKKGNRRLKQAPKDSILFCFIGSSVGRKIGYVSQDCYFVNTFFNLRAKHYNNLVFYYYLKSSLFKNKINPLIKGMIPYINIKDLLKITIPFPNKELQSSIYQKIMNLSPLIKKIEEGK
ncbi:restriction endonuclease subunit S [Ureaplasma canigenitalium]|uniref:restriction endonuclease subunit S n=1 Tax=Ureaplasma canigenitalium TaxID=42092 RepID=UPI0004E24632|nr:restriction endonuclease subunit S [Ureaplasma canigenitalium]